MPSFRQYWSTMPNTTRHHYIKTHRDFSVFKRYIITHARNNNVTITEDVGDASFDSFRSKKRTSNTQSISQPSPKRLRRSGPPSPLLPIEEPQELHIEEPQLLTQIEELQAAAVNAPPAIAINGARKPLVLNGITIEVDPQTLMVNATQMCSAADKLFGNYRRLDSTEEFLQELSSDIHISITGLIHTIQGGRPELQGTWVDWRVALHLAQWLSPAVQVQVTGWICELRNENDQLLTQIEELQAAAVNAPPAIAINGARKPLVLNGITIEVNPESFMVNATQMCRAAGKLFGHYRRLDSTEEFLQALSSVIHIRITGLIYTIQGGRPELQGTWVDWRVALHLAQWLSPAVQVQVTGWIGELRIENDQLLTQIEELQAAAAISPHANALNGARKPLVLNGITIEVNAQTLMVNATQMCRAAGKMFGHYWELESTKKYLQELSLDIGIPISKLVQRNQSGRGTSQDTNVHFLVALHLAYWLSIEVQVQFSKWIGELMLTGRVELGNEMSPQQLDEAWQQRVIDAQRLQKDAEDRLAGAIEETRKELIAKASEERELAVQKTREELMATVQALVRDTEQLPQFPDGANVLYAAYIDNGLIKYGQSSNFIRRLADHQRHYPEFLLIKALLCDNAVAAEKKLRDFVAKKRIGAEFRGEKEIIGFKTQEDIYLLIKAMQKSCRNRSSDNAVELKRIEADVTIQIKKMELLMHDKITFEQYLLMK